MVDTPSHRRPEHPSHPRVDRYNADPGSSAADAPVVDADVVLVRRMLAMTPDDRLLGLARAAEFFASARRV